MKPQDKDPNQPNRTTKPPREDEIAKQKQRQKAEEQEVAGRHRNDGQKTIKAGDSGKTDREQSHTKTFVLTGGSQ